MSRAISRYPSHWARDCMTSLLRWFRWRCRTTRTARNKTNWSVSGFCRLVWPERLLDWVAIPLSRRGNDNYYCHSVSCFSSSQNRKCHSPIAFSGATDSKTGHPASVTLDTTDSETIVPMHSTLPTAKNKQIPYIYIQNPVALYTAGSKK